MKHIGHTNDGMAAKIRGETEEHDPSTAGNGVPVSRFRGAQRHGFGAALMVFALSGCGGSQSPGAASTPPPPPPPPPADHVPPPIEEGEQPPAVQIYADVGFETPEAVYFDKKRDIYLISNINGKPLDKDDNGFISKMTPDGKLTLKFIDGADPKIELNAPKGLTISGDTLYVADIDRVRLFDALTGLPKGEVLLPGATFVNAVATGKDGIIYATDSGLDASFTSTGTDAVYVIKNQKAEKLLASAEKLGDPNGVLGAEGGAWVATFGSGEIYFVSDTGEQKSVQKMPKGKNDGIVIADDGRFFVSSWEASAIFAGKPGEEFHQEISGVESPAAIGYDCRRNRILIPSFSKNEVVVHTLSAPTQE